MAENNEQSECKHVGTYGPINQTVLNNGIDLLIILSYNCTACGRLFTSINPQPLRDLNTSSFAVPSNPLITKGPKA